MLHHPGKAEGSVYRGSSYIEGGIDAMWGLKNETEGNYMGLDTVTLIPTQKFRFGIPKEHSFKYVEGKGFESVMGDAVAAKTTFNKLRKILENNQGEKGIPINRLKTLAFKEARISDRQVREFVKVHLECDAILSADGERNAKLLKWKGFPEEAQEKQTGWDFRDDFKPQGEEAA
jgi:hypothetical protein